MKQHIQLKTSSKLLLLLVAIVPLFAVVNLMPVNDVFADVGSNPGGPIFPTVNDQNNSVYNQAENNQTADEFSNGGFPTPDLNNGVLDHETQELTIQVPFERTGHSCQVPVQADKVMVCIIYGAGFEPEEEELTQEVEDSETELSLPPEWDPSLNGVHTNEPEPQEELTYEQRILQELYDMEEKGIELSSTQLETKLLLEDPPELCDFGTEHGKGIQDESYHEVREPAFEIAKNIDYGSNSINKHYATLVEACEGWDKSKIYQLGVERLNVIADAQKAFEKEEARIAELMSLSFQYDGPATQRDLDNESELARGTFCGSTLYQNHTKANYGCLNIDEVPNRGGYTNPLNNPIYQQYLEAKETGVMVVNPDLTPDNYISPMDNARSYMKVYGYIPVEVAQQLTAEQLAKLLEEIKTTSGEKQ